MLDNPILDSISSWFKRHFSDPEAISLFMTLVVGILLLEFFGHLLMPVLVSIVIAYLLVSPVRFLIRIKFPSWLAVLVTYVLFIGFVAYGMFVLVPLLVKQFINLAHALPNAVMLSHAWINDFLQRYPRVASIIQVQQLTSYAQSQAGHVGQTIFKISLSTIPGIIQIILYFVLVPILVFFFLKDRRVIMAWFGNYLPSNRGLVMKVLSEVRMKIGAYVRSRVVEIIIVAAVTMTTFSFFGLQYALLLGAAVGVSVIVPYVGAVLVTVPVAIIALMEWGFSPHFLYIMVAYGLIILLDANILFPLLFSETMDLHPVAIILSVVFFGAIWGFWGVFFAIPLATLVNAVLRSWPQSKT